jgi:hypothetical protein
MGRPSTLRVTIPEHGGIAVAGHAIRLDGWAHGPQAVLLADRGRMGLAADAGVCEQCDPGSDTRVGHGVGRPADVRSARNQPESR